MKERLVDLRVRPPRIVVLINKEADAKALKLAFEFYSKIWGGRYFPIFPVSRDFCDKLTEFRLQRLRPDFVLGVELDHDFWNAVARRTCQPRRYVPLTDAYVDALKRHHWEEFILIDPAVIKLSRAVKQAGSIQRPLRLIDANDSSPLSIFSAAMFGVHHADLRTEMFESQIKFTPRTHSDLVQFAAHFVESRVQSWLEVGGNGLRVKIADSPFGLSHMPPTFVLVRDVVLDLSLFWNLRSGFRTSIPAWIIPIPALSTYSDELFTAIKAWIGVHLANGPVSTHCNVVSQSIKTHECKSFVSRLRNELSSTPVKVVDCTPPPNSVPVVIPYDHDENWPIQIQRRRVSFVPPKIKAFTDITFDGSWFVEMRKDVATGRALGDMQLPPGGFVMEVLNGPCPPVFMQSVVPEVGDGVESINIRCSSSASAVRFQLPESREILEELLLEAGMKPIIDEKRSIYLPAIKRLGGMHFAAKNLSGALGGLILALQGSPKVLGQLQSICKTGPSGIGVESYMDGIDAMLLNQSERIKRIGRQRYLKFSRESVPEDSKLQTIINHWVRKKIVVRLFDIGKCDNCRKRNVVSRLSGGGRFCCKYCGYHLPAQSKVQFAYRLMPVIERAIREGIVPVIQTGRFLKEMTNTGFFWLPGVKYENEGSSGDVDIVACCDGYVVFCECKNLDGAGVSRQAWDEMEKQFAETVRVAKKCEADIVVLASRVEKYPVRVAKRLKSFGDSTPVLLLNKHDLDRGSRDSEFGGGARMKIHELLPKKFTEFRRRKDGKTRTIGFGGLSHNE